MTPSVFTRWLHELNEYGACVLTDVPAEEGRVREVCGPVSGVALTILAYNPYAPSVGVHHLNCTSLCVPGCRSNGPHPAHPLWGGRYGCRAVEWLLCQPSKAVKVHVYTRVFVM